MPINYKLAPLFLAFAAMALAPFAAAACACGQETAIAGCCDGASESACGASCCGEPAAAAETCCSAEGPQSGSHCGTQCNDCACISSYAGPGWAIALRDSGKDIPGKPAPVAVTASTPGIIAHMGAPVAAPVAHAGAPPDLTIALCRFRC